MALQYTGWSIEPTRRTETDSSFKELAMKGTKGFTLIELLVVIAIIALLLAILVPALDRVKVQATGIVCLSNLDGLTMSWLLYAGDNDTKVIGATPAGPNAYLYCMIY